MINMDLYHKLSSYTGLSNDDIITVVKKYSNKYKKLKIPKKNSEGTRDIFHPCRELKIFQYAIKALYLDNIPISSIARAYIRGAKSPLKVIASEHCKFPYTIRIDFKDFFPSIKFEDLLFVLKDKYIILNDESDILKKILFREINDKTFLPIGAPTSPIISNIVMRKIDNLLLDKIKSFNQKTCVSRYADDIYFSSYTKSLCNDFHKYVYNIIQDEHSPSLYINSKKTLHLWNGNFRSICGIIITSQGGISIGRDRKIKIKKYLYLFNNGKLNTDEIKSLKGYLAFVKDCEPSFYNRLIIKYGSDILKK